MTDPCCPPFGPLLPKRIKLWRNDEMVWRWSVAVMLGAEERFNRIRGYRELAILSNELAEKIDSRQATG